MGNNVNNYIHISVPIATASAAIACTYRSVMCKTSN